MKLKQEHQRNLTPGVRGGVYFLTLKGEVVHVGHGANIIREVAIMQDMDLTPFDGLSYIVSMPPEREFLFEELSKLYLGK